MFYKAVAALLLISAIGLACTNPQTVLPGCEALAERYCMD